MFMKLFFHAIAAKAVVIFFSQVFLFYLRKPYSAALTVCDITNLAYELALTSCADLLFVFFR